MTSSSSSSSSSSPPIDWLKCLPVPSTPSPTSISSLESYYHITLPSSYKQLLADHQGHLPHRLFLHAENVETHKFITTEMGPLFHAEDCKGNKELEAVALKDVNDELFAVGETEDNENGFNVSGQSDVEPKSKAKGKGTAKAKSKDKENKIQNSLRFFAFSADPQGRYFCIDTTNNYILLISHSPSPSTSPPSHYIIATSFDEFLQKLQKSSEFNNKYGKQFDINQIVDDENDQSNKEWEMEIDGEEEGKNGAEDNENDDDDDMDMDGIDIDEDNEAYLCDLCMKTISEFRYHCVTCSNFDLCRECHDSGKQTKKHKKTHQMEEVVMESAKTSKDKAKGKK